MLKKIAEEKYHLKNIHWCITIIKMTKEFSKIILVSRTRQHRRCYRLSLQHTARNQCGCLRTDVHKILQIFQLNSQICRIWRQLNDGLVWCEYVICLSSRARPQPGCHWPQTNYWQKQYCIATAALHQQLDQVWHSSHKDGIVPKGHASL